MFLCDFRQLNFVASVLMCKVALHWWFTQEKPNFEFLTPKMKLLSTF